LNNISGGFHSIFFEIIKLLLPMSGRKKLSGSLKTCDFAGLEVATAS
jgi:hypothetical protein